MPWAACEIGAHQSTIVNTVRSGVPGLVCQKRVRHAGLEVSVLCVSSISATADREQRRGERAYGPTFGCWPWGFSKTVLVII